jgi:hypothetical protein
MRFYGNLCILALSLLACNSASAARFPNAVEKKIVVSGPATASIAELFGMDATRQSSISLQLGRGDAWAVYLLKQDTKVKLLNDNDGSPVRHNALDFSPRPSPSLAISPFWLDLGTGHPNPRVGYYRFSSPFIPETLDRDDAWSRLVRRLKKESQWEAGKDVQFRRCFACNEGKQLCIEIYRNQDYSNNKIGHSVSVTVGSVSGR